MKLFSLFAATLLVPTMALLADPPTPQTEFRKTLSAAAKENKMAFILMGRETCSICNATKKGIKDGKINVTADEFVMGDVNIDDPKIQAEFMRKYGNEKFGEMLPFVVVTDSHGKALASSSGFKSAEQWNTLLADAKAKAGAKPGNAPKSNWPFNATPVPKP